MSERTWYRFEYDQWDQRWLLVRDDSVNGGLGENDG